MNARRAYYLEHKEQIIAANYAASDRRKKANRVKLAVLKEATPCADCNVHYPSCVMEFHHLRDKIMSVGQMVNTNWSWKRVEAEIAKCVLLCANCHRIRTHEVAS